MLDHVKWNIITDAIGGIMFDNPSRHFIYNPCGNVSLHGAVM